MEFEDIQRQGKKEPFGFDFFLAAEKETAEVQVFLDVGERAFGLDGSVDPQELSFGGSDFFQSINQGSDSLIFRNRLYSYCSSFNC